MWINHHDLFTRVRSVNPKLMVINLALLLTASVIPFPTAVLSAAMRDGSNRDQVVASVLYAGVGLSMALSWTLLYSYLRTTPRLLVEASDVTYMRDGVRRTLLSLVAFPAGAALAFVSPTVSLVAYAALPFFFIATLLYADGK